MPVAGCPVGGHPFILPGADWNSTAFPATSHPAARKHTQARAPIHTRSVAHTCAHNTILWHWRRRVDASTRPHTFSHTTDKPMPRHRAAKKRASSTQVVIQEKGRGPHPGKDSRTPVRRVNLFSLLLEPTGGGGTASQCQEQASYLHDTGRRRRRRTQARAGEGALFVSRAWPGLPCCNAGGQQALLGGWPCTLLRVPALVADATTADPPVQPLAWLFVALQVRPSSAALPQGAYHLRGFSAQITLLLARPRERP
ncbi:hypothetical protein PSV09DRAFT_2260748 [Bipolaris maydis]|uniref:uncharacterized protein n=1 Tax=Cochliobolus heterostrophus TaxID=5016 RepID=UPI0024D42D61|nr:hypothetical protein PSV09DRAFT_2260748 [Bipolaris maydis]KAJ6268866.1 hypothetical protein PSV08DRAFT_248972 [Bipolaris maydis]